MEKLKPLYDSESEIPKDYALLYEEVDGKFILTGVEGLKTQADIEKVLKGKTHEVDNHKVTKKELDDLKKKFEGVDPSKYKEMVAEIEHKKLKKENPDKDLEKVILQNDLDNMQKELEKKDGVILVLQNEKKTTKIEKATLAAARKLNLDPKYDEDVLLRTSFLDISENDDVVTLDGKSVEEFLTPLTSKFGLPSNGSGARSPSGNPNANDDNAAKFAEAKKAGDTKGMLLHAPDAK